MQRVFTDGSERCPVMFLENSSQEDLSLSGAMDSFTYSHLENSALKVMCGFHCKVLEINSVMAELDRTNKRFTNHSVRKMRKLQKARLSPTKITAMIGHKKIQSLSEMDPEDHRQVSAALSSKRMPLRNVTNCSITYYHLSHSTITAYSSFYRTTLSNVTYLQQEKSYVSLTLIQMMIERYYS